MEKYIENKAQYCKKCGVLKNQMKMCLDPKPLSEHRQDWYCEECYLKMYPEKKKRIEGIRPSKIIAFADEGNKLYFVDDNKIMWEVKRHELIKSEISYGVDVDIVKVPKLKVGKL
jgi:hypothetical protein